MILKYVKGINSKVGDSFFSEQFDCHCKYEKCNFTLIDTDLIDVLESVITRFHTLRINSGYRCSAHNHDVGGKAGSIHLLGKAADIFTELASPQEIHEYLENINGGLGLYSTFVHVDVRGYKARWFI